MEDKYYLPKIEEFHIGFEYEVRQHEMQYGECVYGNEWKTIDCEGNMFLQYIDISSGNIRVKYLDSSDIESLGFKKSNKNSWAGYKDYFLDSINPEYPYFLFATIHVPIRDDMYKILVHRYYSEDEPIDEDDNYKEPTCVYVGKIKNKSELNQLLKRLNIINE